MDQTGWNKQKLPLEGVLNFKSNAHTHKLIGVYGYLSCRIGKLCRACPQVFVKARFAGTDSRMMRLALGLHELKCPTSVLVKVPRAMYLRLFAKKTIWSCWSMYSTGSPSLKSIFQKYCISFKTVFETCPKNTFVHKIKSNQKLFFIEGRNCEY